MKAVLIVGIFLVARISAILPTHGSDYVTSHGKQFSCAKGAKSPGIGHRSFSTIWSQDNNMYTCDVVAPTDAAYRTTAKYPSAPANAKQSNSFVIGTYDLKTLWLCRPMVSGDEARLQADNRAFSITDPRTNSDVICQEETTETKKLSGNH